VKRGAYELDGSFSPAFSNTSPSVHRMMMDSINT